MSDLATLEQAFYTGDYNGVVSSGISGLSDEEKQRGNLLLQRALIHSGKARDVSSALASAEEADLKMTKIYADYILKDAKAVQAAQAVIAENPNDNTVKLLGGLILAAEGRLESAVELLATHENSLECVMLQVYIYLSQNEVEKAANLLRQVKKWANDHVIFNVAESWVALREGDETAQKAYYIFEENNALAPTARSFLGEAIAQLELRRFPEAAESLKQASSLDGEAEDVLAVSSVLAAIQGTENTARDKLNTRPDSLVFQDLQEKADLFSKVVAKYAT